MVKFKHKARLATKVPAEGLLVAKTAPRERQDVDHGTFWHEYRVRKLTDAESENLRRGVVVSPFGAGAKFGLESRRLDTENDVVVTRKAGWDFSKWELRSAGDTVLEALDAFLGDSAFQKAESLCLEHRVLVHRLKLVWAAHAVEVEASKTVSAASERHNETVKAVSNEFDKKAARLLKRKGPEAVATLKAETLARVNPILAELRAAWEADNAAFQVANRKRLDLQMKPVTLADYPDLVALFRPVAVTAATDTVSVPA